MERDTLSAKRIGATRSPYQRLKWATAPLAFFSVVAIKLKSFHDHWVMVYILFDSAKVPKYITRVVLCPFFFETVAQRRSVASLSDFGLGHVREYAPFSLLLSSLHLILCARSQYIWGKYAENSTSYNILFLQSMGIKRDTRSNRCYDLPLRVSLLLLPTC